MMKDVIQMQTSKKRQITENSISIIDSDQQEREVYDIKSEEEQNLSYLTRATYTPDTVKEESLNYEHIQLLTKSVQCEKLVNNFKRRLFEIFRVYPFKTTYQLLQQRMKNNNSSKACLISLFLRIKDEPLDTYLSGFDYQQAVEELAQMICCKILDIYNQFSKEEYEDYTATAKLNERMAKKPKNEEFLSLKFTAFNMFKLDILSVFLLCEYKYRQLPEESRVQYIFHYEFLMKVLGMGRQLLKVLKQRHNENAGIMTYKYEQEFDEFITIYSIFRFKFRISNHLRWNSKDPILKQSNKWLEMQFCQLMPIYQTNHKILFRFCEIALVRSRPQAIQIQCQKTKEQILHQIQQSCKGQSADKIKKNIIEIASLFKLTLKSVHQWQERIQTELTAQLIQKEQPQCETEAFNWIGFRLYQKKDSQQEKTSIKLNISDNKQRVSPKLKKIIRIARDRFCQLCDIKKNVAQLRKNKQKKRVIFFCKFEYYYSRFKKTDKPLTKSEKQKVCSLIIAMQNQKILFTTLLNKTFSENLYSSILIQYFKKAQVRDITILFNDFNYNSTNASSFLLKDQLNQKFNINTHIVPNAFLFIGQSGFNQVLGKSLQIYQKELTQNNFYLAVSYIKSAIQSIFQTYFDCYPFKDTIQRKKNK